MQSIYTATYVNSLEMRYNPRRLPIRSKSDCLGREAVMCADWAKTETDQITRHCKYVRILLKVPLLDCILNVN